MPLGVGELPELGAVNRIVLADVDVIRIFGNIEVTAIGNIAEGLVRRRGDCDSIRISGCLLKRPLGPLTGDYICGLSVLRHVHRDGSKLLVCAALQEQDFVIVRDVHELPEIFLGFLDDAVKNLAAMAHFHDGHAASAVIQHFFLCFLKNFHRQYSGAG